MKKIHTIKIGFAILVLCSSFLLKSKQPVPVNPVNDSKTIMTDDPLLYYLYMDNTADKPVFQKLIDRVYKTDGNKNKNIVLQFFHRSDGKLTLSVYVGKKNRTNYDDAKEFKLSPYKCDDQTLLSIDGKDVFLGDMEIDKQDSDIPALKAMAADHDKYRYVVFIPGFATVGTGINPKPVIQYTAYLVKDTLDACDPDKLKLVLPPASFQTNPSPPKNGN
jgi:hypothetical protein